MILYSRWRAYLGRSLESAWGFSLALAIVAAVGLCVAYAGRVDVGMYYDDYHLVRPWSPIELRRAWLGSWDPTGIEPAFYRPITAGLFAVRFHLFALNDTAMHVLSLIGHGVCAVALGWFLRREGASTRLAAFAVWLYSVYPVFPYAQVSWLTNQMHLAQSLVVLASLTVWQSVRDRGAVWWSPLAVLSVMSFLVKEDGVMLLPVIAALTVLRVRILGAEPPRAWLRLLSCAVIVVAGLLALRYARLGRLGGYGVPRPYQGLSNYLRGLESALFLWPTTRIWQAVASVMAIGALVAGLSVAHWRRGRLPLLVTGACLAAALSLNVPAAFHSAIPYSVFAWQGLASGIAISLLVMGLGVALWRRDRFALFLMCAGLAVALCFNLPFILVSKREQYNLVALGSVMATTGAVQALWTHPTPWVRRWVCGIVLVAVTIPYPLLARHMAGDFLPCAAPVLRGDQEARAWWIVPGEIREWIDAKRQQCVTRQAPAPLSDLPVVSWDVYAEERPGDALSYRWTSERPVFLVRRDAISMTLALRRPDATADRPVKVRIQSSAGTNLVTLESGAWHYTDVTFATGPLAWLRRGQRVDLRIDRWFVPAARDSRSQDLRRHGLQLRVENIRWPGPRHQ